MERVADIENNHYKFYEYFEFLFQYQYDYELYFKAIYNTSLVKILVVLNDGIFSLYIASNCV